ncbi:hypothetical protein [Virgibacillus halodenitrificans]|uniref:hypothetical protein n=1 Tax=Virgibacillus halodenitrificans TaxID=1482 RepID=UPI00045D062B|nr:hypothetical protein [Virgibacillus halodenitrificans]MCJ0929742.1 hypothetical protein [Virgibacillus halodenitrificans]CDQ31393.1 hypothetical protein BN993_00770 [Virgibacillus halodenitrificans]
MRPIKIEHEDIKKVIQSDHPYIQVGTRKFLLLEVEEANSNDCYEVTDSEEQMLLMAALDDKNPVLSEDEIKNMLGS